MAIEYNLTESGEYTVKAIADGFEDSEFSNSVIFDTEKKFVSKENLIEYTEYVKNYILDNKGADDMEYIDISSAGGTLTTEQLAKLNSSEFVGLKESGIEYKKSYEGTENIYYTSSYSDVSNNGLLATIVVVKATRAYSKKSTTIARVEGNSSESISSNTLENIVIGSAKYIISVRENKNNTFTGSNTFNANVKLSSTLTDSSSSVGTNGQILTSTASGVKWKSYSDIQGIRIVDISTSQSGTLDTTNYNLLVNDSTIAIRRNGEMYYQYSSDTTYLVYTNTKESSNKFTFDSITITKSSRAWVYKTSSIEANTTDSSTSELNKLNVGSTVYSVGNVSKEIDTTFTGNNTYSGTSTFSNKATFNEEVETTSTTTINGTIKVKADISDINDSVGTKGQVLTKGNNGVEWKTQRTSFIESGEELPAASADSPDLFVVFGDGIYFKDISKA